MARQTVSLLVAAALLLALSASVSAQRTVVVSNNEEAARALASQDVSIIRLAYNVNLARVANSINAIVAQNGGALPINRALTIESVPGAARKIIDFGYLASKVVIAPGQAITFNNVQLRRAQVSAPVGIFAYSPGATVIISNAEYVLQACWPQDAAQFYHTAFFRRTIPGSSIATFSPNSYLFTDVQYELPQLGPLSTGGYSMVHRDATITCQAYPDVTCDFQANPVGCLNTVYTPALQRINCPQCTCVNDCLTLCQAAGIPGPSSTC